MHRVLHQSMDDFKQKKNIKSWLEHIQTRPLKTNHLHIDITNTKSSHISLLTISTFFIKNSTLSLQLKFAFPKLIHKVPEQQKTRLCCDIKKFNLSRIEKLLQLHCQIPLFY